MTSRTVRLLIAASTVLAGAVVTGASAMPEGGAASRGGERGSLVLTGIPSNPVVNPSTHTLYVPIQCRDVCNGPPGKLVEHVLDLIDTSKCNLDRVSGCHVIGTAVAGTGPLAVVIDHRTDTIYVADSGGADSGGAVTVLDGGRCNASNRTRCGRPLATIRTGGFDVAEALNPRTHTLYVAAPSGDVFVINVARCSSRTTTGCRQHIRKVKDTRGPDGIDVDVATNTVYVADGGMMSPGDTVSVINGAACNGSTGTGCGHRPRTITVGSSPYWLTVDQATDTVYVANNNDNDVSVINGASCNSTVTSGCSRHPRAVNTGGGPTFLAVDQSRHTLFVMNETDDTISELNIRTCNGHTHSGCPQRARNERAAFNPATGYNPAVFALGPVGTAYLVSFNSKLLAPVGVKRCNALTLTGCRVEAPNVPLNLAFPEVDPATDTIYAGNAGKPGIAVLNGAKCNVQTRSGCSPVATIPFPHEQANLGSIDQATHTLYAADTFVNKVYAIDIRHCNAHDTSGCSAQASKMTVGIHPNLPVLNPSTHTLYVSAGQKENRIYVIDAATCNAEVTSGCGQTPPAVTVGLNAFTIDVSPKTDTVYAAVLGANFLNNTVSVVNGATCNGTDHAGCASAVVAQAKVGLGAATVVVDDPVHTVYVDNNADGDLPGTVSVINGATCNGSVTTSCGATKPTIAVGRSPVGMALDAATQHLYVADYSHAAVSIVNSANCNAVHTSGCGATPPEQNVGSQPGFVFVNLRNKTVYATVHANSPTVFGSWSIFRASP
jgi:DNA-binding beta-propeller fold protein YncE